MDSPRSVMKSIGEPESDGSPPNKRLKTRSSTEFLCGVCFINPGEEYTFKARCSHKFCMVCYEMYVQGKIKNDGQSKIFCMEENCKVILTDQDVKLCSDVSTYNRYVFRQFCVGLTCTYYSPRYRELLLEAYVKCSSYLRFCPYPSCKQTILCKDVTTSSLSINVPIVRCSSEEDHRFCFGCGVDDDHRPSVCKTVSLWLSAARDDAGTSEWLKANTRSCPKCKQSIEKNGGCKYVIPLSPPGTNLR